MPRIKLEDINRVQETAVVRVSCYDGERPEQVMQRLINHNFLMNETEYDIATMSLIFKVKLPNNYVFHYLALREEVDNAMA